MTRIKKVEIGTNSLATDIWGVAKVSLEHSLLRSLFTSGIPKSLWKEEVNEIESEVYVNCSTNNGKLVVASPANPGDSTMLRTFRAPRYQPNRGHRYATAMFFPEVDNGARRWGYFTRESGAFFELNEARELSGVIRTTIDGITADTPHPINLEDFPQLSGLDLQYGNIYDIQMQWRGVGDYKFFIDFVEVLHIKNINQLKELSIFNPANPLAFEVTNVTGVSTMECGCVDISSEGGDNGGGSYGSIGITTELGSVTVTDPNTPVIVIKSLLTVGGMVNTRDTLMIAANAYANNKVIFRIWNTRDETAIDSGTQSWIPFKDGHLEYMELDEGAGAGQMSFDTSKASLTYTSRVDTDTTFTTSALFDHRSDIYLSPGDYLIITMHREDGTSNALVGSTIEFSEEV